MESKRTRANLKLRKKLLISITQLKKQVNNKRMRRTDNGEDQKVE